MVLVDCNTSPTIKGSSSDGDLSLANQTPGLGSLPARTRDSGVGASTSSGIEGVGPPSNSSSYDNVTSYSSLASLTNDSVGKRPKKPPVPLPKNAMRKAKTVNFKDDVDVVLTDANCNMQTVQEELATDEHGIRHPPTNTPQREPVLAQTVTVEIETKFPNSFVASKRKQTVPRSQTETLMSAHEIHHCSVGSNISSDSTGSSSLASVLNDSVDAVTSFQTAASVETISAFQRANGQNFRSSVSSTSSSLSSQSSRSSSHAVTAPLLVKTSSKPAHSPMMLSPSSSLSSSSSHNTVPAGEEETLKEVPEYDAVGTSSCDKCSEGKCRTVYLHVPELPFGWEKVEDPHYGVYYIDHVNRRTQYENPVQTAKKQTDEVTNTYPRQKKQAESGTKRSASENNMNGQLYSSGRLFFTKNPEELKGEFTKTSLVKSVRGLGFTIVGGNYRDTQFLQIKNVVENGPAYVSGKLKTGDVIVRVNNTCVLGFTHQDVVRLFQSIAPGETVELETCRGYPLNFDPDDPNTEIVTTVAVTLPQDAGTSATPSNSNGYLDQHKQLKSLPDLARSAGTGLNSTSSLSPSNSQDEGGMHGIMSNEDGNAIPDLVSLSISKPEILTIPIVKGPMGFGFTIADSPYGQRVKQILDQGRCKNLAEGDLLLQINNVMVRELPHQRTVQVLKECKQDQETAVVVQRGGIPPPGKGKKFIKMSRSFDERQQQPDSNGPSSPGAYFFRNQEQNFNEQMENGLANNQDEEIQNGDMSNADLPPPSPEEGDEDPDDVDGGRSQNKNSPQDANRPQRPKTPLDGGRSKTPTVNSGLGSPRPGYMDMQQGRRDYQDINKFSNHSRADVDGSNIGRPPPAPNRPEFFPRYDSRVRGTDPRDPFLRSYGSSVAPSMQNNTNGDDKWAGRDVKPGQFRSRTPGPEMMARGGPGPDYTSRPEVHRPKTPTAADMRNKPPMSSHSYGAGDFRTSGRYTPNPSSELGRQYRSPYQEYARNWPDFSSPPTQRRFEAFENSSLNRSYAGEFARPSPFQSSIGPGRPMRQSTSFESENPAPSSITRVPRKPPPHPAFQARSQGGGIPEEGQVIEMAVTLHRQESGYGFRIIGGTEEGSQVSVGHIVPGGAADVDGRLRQFDEITHVDGNSVLNASHHRVVQLMTNAALNGRVTLSIRRVLGPDLGNGPQYPYDVVVSRRENEGFGFVIISSVNKGASVDEFIDGSDIHSAQAVVCPWIGHIQENSPAARCGRLHIGDRILAVNGVDTSNMHHKDVVSLIKESGFSVALTIGPPPDDNSSTTSYRSSAGSSGNPPPLYSVDRPDMNIQSWERNQPGMGRDRPRTPSNQGSDDSGEIYQVELHRGSRGFGFSIRGGREFNAMPLFVLRIAEDGAADLDGRLKVGDQILEINSFNTDSMTHTEAIDIIQNGGPTVRLLMRRTNKPPPIFDGPPSSPGGLSPGNMFTPNIPPLANGPISHSSPHMARRQQTLPPPPPDLPHPNEFFHNYPPLPPPSQQHLRFNNY
ncbi:membrane-associated guanylate kinase, WW and PDZ domain-containing protein 1-like isoform X2 [Physella acuta]|uniref:membrane-associated guanylate kinase, WW and PDZ domain-containing protein 1-like isoform X2 n=1 Tax=Physella acuta TaxID=109671 RepID=UPI0027DB4498|nr:membrane-associated guanylate kinase, WW and PDZ domain-containing protein 1-like isoform X2 [Physella acuta]